MRVAPAQGVVRRKACAARGDFARHASHDAKLQALFGAYGLSDHVSAAWNRLQAVCGRAPMSFPSWKTFLAASLSISQHPLGTWCSGRCGSPSVSTHCASPRHPNAPGRRRWVSDHHPVLEEGQEILGVLVPVEEEIEAVLERSGSRLACLGAQKLGKPGA